MTNRLELNWKLDGFVDEQRYYCSESPIDVNNLPTPKVILSAEARSHVDNDITEGKKYYIRIGSVKNNVEKVSDEMQVKAQSSDMYWDNVVTLLHFDGDLVDKKDKTWTISGNAAINSSYSKFGGSSIKLPARNDYVTCSTQNLISRYELFTIECWFYFDGTKDPSGQSAIFSQTATGSFMGQTLFLGTGSTNALRFARGANVGSAVGINGTTIVTPNEWHHAALSFDGSKIYLFLDGNLEATANNTDGWYPSGSFRIGAYLNPSYTTYGMYGYIDEFRITKGVARYTQSFTKPTQPFSDT